MALDTVGKLVKILPEQSGAGKSGTAWRKQEFIVETLDQYPKMACFSLWGEKVDLLQRLQIGEELKISFNIESREYNERWYTDLRAWKIDKGGKSGDGNESKSRDQSFSDYPTETFKNNADESDDLPF